MTSEALQRSSSLTLCPVAVGKKSGCLDEYLCGKVVLVKESSTYFVRDDAALHQVGNLRSHPGSEAKAKCVGNAEVGALSNHSFS